MKKNIVLWGIATILVVLAIYVKKFNSSGSTNSTPPDSAAQITSSQPAQDLPVPVTLDPSGPKAADFTLTDLDGNKVVYRT